MDHGRIATRIQVFLEENFAGLLDMVCLGCYIYSFDERRGAS
jgi:hypothetical protein